MAMNIFASQNSFFRTRLLLAVVATAMAAGDDSDASVLSDPLGPLWYRGLVTADPDAQAARNAAKPPLPLISLRESCCARPQSSRGRRWMCARFAERSRPAPIPPASIRH